MYSHFIVLCHWCRIPKAIMHFYMTVHTKDSIQACTFDHFRHTYKSLYCLVCRYSTHTYNVAFRHSSTRALSAFKYLRLKQYLGDNASEIKQSDLFDGFEQVSLNGILIRTNGLWSDYFNSRFSHRRTLRPRWWQLGRWTRWNVESLIRDAMMCMCGW